MLLIFAFNLLLYAIGAASTQDFGWIFPLDQWNGTLGQIAFYAVNLIMLFVALLRYMPVHILFFGLAAVILGSVWL